MRQGYNMHYPGYVWKYFRQGRSEELRLLAGILHADDVQELESLHGGIAGRIRKGSPPFELFVRPNLKYWMSESCCVLFLILVSALTNLLTTSCKPAGIRGKTVLTCSLI